MRRNWIVLGLILVMLIIIGTSVFLTIRDEQEKTPQTVKVQRLDEIQDSAVKKKRILPDRYYPPKETLGAIDPSITQENIHQTICVSHYTDKVRPPTSYTNRIKKRRMAKYNLPGKMSDYELDHMISLQLGGCPRCETNLWMESYLGEHSAREKDVVETWLKRQVCAGKMTLKAAQDAIIADWYAVYLQRQKTMGNLPVQRSQ